MADRTYNPTFKRPSHLAPSRLRSPSPPHAFVEPLSPAKPTPIEPNFNYPPINQHVGFSVRPENAYTAATKTRAPSDGNKNGHRRTSSTIDTLAEVALAASPSYQAQSHSRNSSAHFEPNGHAFAHPQLKHQYGSSEPPHKRARSELLPSPQIGQYASRPATSYEPNGWYHTAQAEPSYNTRVEEAALLLNFQSGGWPGGNTQVPPSYAHAPRPHANSFPQDAFHTRPADPILPQQAVLLPPFNPQDAQRPAPTLPSPQQTTDDSPRHYDTNMKADVEMQDAVSDLPVPTGSMGEQPVQTQTPPDDTDSQSQSTDITMSEASDAPKVRRGWPKGKPRGPGSKKTMAEKVASKRAASKRKTPDSKSAKRKAARVSNGVDEDLKARRKSLSDALVFGEQDIKHDEHHTVSRARSVPRETPMLIRDISPSKATRRKAAANPDTICAGCQTTRESANSNGELDEWISCNGCKKWFHIDCAGFKKASEVRDVDKFFCNDCESTHGKTTYVRKSARAHASVDYAELQRGVLKTSEESVEHHYIQPIKDGTFQFDPETFPRMRPEMITRDFFERSGTFVEPICIPAEWNPRPWAKETHESTNADAQASSMSQDDELAGLLPDDLEYDTVSDHKQDKLEMVMPEGLTVRQVCSLVGADYPIDVIDVKTQNSGGKWSLGRWADYYEQEGEEKEIRNVISLEVSQTKLGRLLQRPKLVRDIDLQDDVWPHEEIDNGKLPRVQFYCLMSVADSFTDFHIDFGGSSVYYHILKGKKTFFFIPPKPKHLKAYEEWNDSPQQNFTFLPSITKECYRVDLHEGDTMLIPSGWIHAVWTPEDSLVIGGNFLNRLSYRNQFKVVDIEKANNTPMKFRYPHFQKVMWYTALRYLKDDPMPPAVSQMFYDGRRFERGIPIWADFDGDGAASDTRPGAKNARYYSQAELDGLPDLVNYIFRTVMLVQGRVEGISADRMKRVGQSIPKGHGEPLEIAKAFALWVAWKRGNEDPPNWSHPDAVLPDSKEGPPKKLSEKKLKDLQKQEAIAAWRIAGPDRQSARVMSKTATSTATDATLVNPLPAVAHQALPQLDGSHHQIPSYAHPPPASVASGAFVMSGISGMSAHPHHLSTPNLILSTPKTSVLGPKRVACDACRKRRIRCKHKDAVTQVPSNSNGVTHPDSADGVFQAQLAPELHDNITVTPPKQRDMNFFNTVMDGGQQIAPQLQANGMQSHGEPQYSNHEELVPGTNAYVDANIPMTMNGVPIFGEQPAKRGRSKACYECRKSKRRCVHDEQGNVDPVKAAETPVPRGTVVSKKRQSTEDIGSPLLVKRQKSDGGPESVPTGLEPAPQMQGHGVLKPQTVQHGRPYQPRASNVSNAHSRRDSEHDEHQQQPQIDPNLFSMYPAPEENEGPYSDYRPYPTSEQPRTYNAPPASYNLPSLEQIANEVLVDMNGNEYHDQGAQQVFDTAPMSNGHVKPDESVDSAVSLPASESKSPPEEAAAVHHELPQPSIETRVAQALGGSTATPVATSTSPVAKSVVDGLPLYQPPAPLSHSPETSRRQSAMPNGVHYSKATSPVEGKRKRDSTSVTPARAMKKVRMDGADEHSVMPPGEDMESIELARSLQQQDLGLRRRSK